MAEASLYERLGGVFAVAAVIWSLQRCRRPAPERRSEVGKPSPPRVAHEQPRPAARPEVHAHPVGLQRCGWTLPILSDPSGATVLGLEEAHRQLKISPAEFEEVAAELGRTLDFVKVPEKEKGEVVAAFAAHKGEVTDG